MTDVISKLIKPDSPYQDIVPLIQHAQSAYPADWLLKPIGLIVEITNACNYKCEGCALQSNSGERVDLPTGLLLDVLQQASDLGIFFLGVTGGEPFLCYDSLLEITRHSPIDLHKINTNGFAFSTPEKSKTILAEMLDAGFSTRNKYLKAYLNVSQGQQNVAGIPIKNSINLLQATADLPDPMQLHLFFNIFDTDQDIVNRIDKIFFEQINTAGIKLDQLSVGFGHIQDMVSCSTEILVKESSATTQPIKKIIESFIHLPLNCAMTETAWANGVLGPKLMLCSDGNVYSCQGFCLVHKLGNVHGDSLYNILKNANDNEHIQALFTGGLLGYYKYVCTKIPSMKNTKLSVSYGPCNVCQYLRNAIDQQNTDK